jgi:hypothetical protein
MNLQQELQSVDSRDDLAAWIDYLRQDYVSNADTWENRDLPTYLEAMAAWLRDMDGYYSRTGLDPQAPPTWRQIGEILLAAKMYE